MHWKWEEFSCELGAVGRTQPNVKTAAWLRLSRGEAASPGFLALHQETFPACVWYCSTDDSHSREDEDGKRGHGIFRDMSCRVRIASHDTNVVECLMEHLSAGLKLQLLPQAGPGWGLLIGCDRR